MRQLFIYYSATGKGDVVANYLKENGVEIRKVKAIDKLPKSTFLKIMTGGFLAGINYKAKLIDFNSNIDDYDQIIIGSPIWNGKLSCPINTVLETLNLEDRNVKFILCSGSGEAPKTVKMLNERYDDPKIIILKEPKSHKDELKKL